MTRDEGGAVVHEVTLVVRATVRSPLPFYSQASAEAWASLVIKEAAAKWPEAITVTSVEAER